VLEFYDLLFLVYDFINIFEVIFEFYCLFDLDVEMDIKRGQCVIALFRNADLVGLCAVQNELGLVVLIAHQDQVTSD